jgi:hypothetical protein
VRASIDRAEPEASPAERGRNLDHHLWSNNGTWFLTCTVYPSRCTKERLRYSLETKSLPIARRRRDAVLAALGAQGVLSTHGHAVAAMRGLRRTLRRARRSSGQRG